MPEIVVTIRNKVAEASVRSIVCDNTDYTVRLDCDEQWGEGPKIVYFVLQGVGALAPATTEDDVCAVPPIRLSDGVGRQLAIGVQQGTVKTSSAAHVFCWPSAEDELIQGIHEDDGVDMTWLEWVNAKMATVDSNVERAEEALDEAQEVLAEAQEILTEAQGAVETAEAAAEDIEESAEQITANKNDILEIKDAVYYPRAGGPLFEQGAISGSDGSKTTSATRIRTRDYLYQGTKAVGTVSGYKYTVAVWDDGGTYLGMWSGSEIKKSGTWLQGATKLTVIGPTTYRYRITLANVDDSAIVPEDGANMTFYEIADPTLSVNGFAADAKATGDAITAATEMKPHSIVGTAATSGDYAFNDNPIGSTPVLRVGASYGINTEFDISYASGGIIELSTPDLKANEGVVCLFCDKNNIIVRRFVTSRFLTYSEGAYKFRTAVSRDAKKLLYSAARGSSVSITVTLHKADAVSNRTCYVAETGDDNGEGTELRPFATIGKAVDCGAQTVNILSDLHEAVKIQKDVTINGNGHSVFGDIPLTAEAYGDILRAPCDADEKITACYIDKTTPLTSSPGGSSWKGDNYNITCYAGDQRLRPVADAAACAATPNSCAWEDGYWYINRPNADAGTRFGYAVLGVLFEITDGHVIINDLGILHAYSNIVRGENCSVEINGCRIIGSVNSNCVSVTNAILIARNVEAAWCWNDGINAQGRGESVVADCFCHDCSDDGVSQHGNTKGTIIGGEFCRCGKGGISSPINSAKIDIYGAYVHDNIGSAAYGIYASNSEGTAQTFRIFGCLVQSNRIGLKIAGHQAVAYGCRLVGNGEDVNTEAGGSVTFLDASTARAMIAEAQTAAASRALTAGEYVTAGEKFYKVTADVAQGETLTPGVNLAETTVGEELAALRALIVSGS